MQSLKLGLVCISEILRAEKLTLPGVKNIIAVASGKGGVGKSTTSNFISYELAERGYLETDGKKVWFDGFLGEQATNLFEMTKRM